MFSFSCSAACATATSEARHPKAQGFSAHAGRLARPLVARSAPWSPGGVISSKRWALRFSFAAWLGVTACFTLPASLARATEPSGPAALTKATQLAAKAAQLRDEGKWDEAIPIAEEVVRLRDANAPANAVSRADAYTALAYLLRANRQRDRAVDVAKKAVAARELSEQPARIEIDATRRRFSARGWHCDRAPEKTFSGLAGACSAGVSTTSTERRTDLARRGSGRKCWRSWRSSSRGR